ncbi:hypothetical protein GCM10008018_63170 [Paenibacillus marchantiophytorum]|uniref:Uncharacterized protein n=1 Tax=Paenibacillus marchantiophytorum TaxID=1619310 RepID=A0ABQ1FFD8_9BACL|nr:hypothetical protein [Paenibacillus marchantiophytorum]GGA08906.1 hypothetical protein GCM10008018_63170 [Paenibacillus marchantiophytorum]
MNLKHYYRQQFLELITQFEHHWEEDPLYHYGFRWHSETNSSYKEIFQISQFPDETLYMIYTIELPDTYKRTNIHDVVRSASSPYELSMYYFADKILLSACVCIDFLQQTSLGFLNQARGELIDLVFSAIQIQNI